MVFSHFFAEEIKQMKKTIEPAGLVGIAIYYFLFVLNKYLTFDNKYLSKAFSVNIKSRLPYILTDSFRTLIPVGIKKMQYNIKGTGCHSNRSKRLKN